MTCETARSKNKQPETDPDETAAERTEPCGLEPPECRASEPGCLVELGDDEIDLLVSAGC